MKDFGREVNVGRAERIIKRKIYLEKVDSALIWCTGLVDESVSAPHYCRKDLVTLLPAQAVLPASEPTGNLNYPLMLNDSEWGNEPGHHH